MFIFINLCLFTFSQKKIISRSFLQKNCIFGTFILHVMIYRWREEKCLQFWLALLLYKLHPINVLKENRNYIQLEWKWKKSSLRVSLLYIIIIDVITLKKTACYPYNYYVRQEQYDLWNVRVRIWNFISRCTEKISINFGKNASTCESTTTCKKITSFASTYIYNNVNKS